MATAKQLAALAKARAARKKNLSKTAKKATTRKTPVKRRTTRKTNPSDSYVVTVRKNSKLYYFTGKVLDTDIDKARTYSNQWIAKAAVEVLRAFKWPANIKKN